jgi:hypothetical protein
MNAVIQSKPQNKCTIRVYATAFDASSKTKTHGKLIDTITRANKRLCTAVARVHYKGDNFIWEWA